MRTISFEANPDLGEPFGMKIMKRWGPNVYTGMLLETYTDKIGKGTFRGIYSDMMVSSFL